MKRQKEKRAAQTDPNVRIKTKTRKTTLFVQKVYEFIFTNSCLSKAYEAEAIECLESIQLMTL